VIDYDEKKIKKIKKFKKIKIMSGNRFLKRIASEIDKWRAFILEKAKEYNYLWRNL